MKKLTVWLLGPYDLAITKIGRGLTHDYEDLASSDLARKINLARLIKLYNEAMQYWIGPAERYKQNLQIALEYLQKERKT